MASSTPASPPPFTFASPAVSFSSEETHEDAGLDFDYESWIQQSKIANGDSTNEQRLWMDDAEAAEVINRYHKEMMLRLADNLPEEAYELSLRDIAELSLPPPPLPPPPPRATRTPRMRSLHRRHGSFISKLFMPSPSRAAVTCSSGGGGRRNMSFSSSSMAVPVLRKKSAPVNYGRSLSMEHDTHSNGYHDGTKRKPMSCYPFFSSSKYKAKHKFTGNQ